MWSAIKRFFSWLFSSCLGGKKPKQSKSEASLLQNDELAQRESDHENMVYAHLSSPRTRSMSTNGINAAFEEHAATAPVAAVKVPSAPKLLTAHEKSVIIAAASCGSNVYIDALDENKQSQATDAIMEDIQTSFGEISTKIDYIKKIAKEQEHENYGQLSAAEQLSVSWNSMSRDILHDRNANERSIKYRCDELMSRASDTMIHRLVGEIMTIFAKCKSMLAMNIFTKQSHANNLKNARPAGDENATTSEGQFFNNANRKTLAILDRFNQNSDNDEARLAH